VFARASALLFRVADAEIAWQRDARVLDRDVPRFHRKGHLLASVRRERGVDRAVALLAGAFRRDRPGGAR
jgi:hypothetical protein